MYSRGGTGYGGNTQRHDPIRNFNFEVVFVGKEAMHRTGFSNVSGLKVQTDFKEYREGGNNGIADQIPMDTRFEPIEMTGGMTQDLDLVNAFSKQFSTEGWGHSKQTYTVYIYLYDRDGKTVLRKTTLYDAWISLYEEGEYDALSQAVKIEKIVVMFQGADVSKS